MQILYVRPISDPYSTMPANFRKQDSYRVLKLWETFAYIVDDGGIITPIQLNKLVLHRIENADGLTLYKNESLHAELAEEKTENKAKVISSKKKHSSGKESEEEIPE